RQGYQAEKAIMQQTHAQADCAGLHWIEGVKQEVAPLGGQNGRRNGSYDSGFNYVTPGYTEHVAEQYVVEMDIRLDLHIEHKPEAKHAGEDDAHTRVLLDAAVLLEKPGRQGAKHARDESTRHIGNAYCIGEHHAGKDGVADGVAHQRP